MPCFAKNSRLSRLLDGGVALAPIGREVIGANSGSDSASNRVHKLRIGYFAVLHNSLALLTFNDLHSAELLTQSEHLIQLARFFCRS